MTVSPSVGNPTNPPSVGRLGVLLFLASLSMLFLAGMVGFLALRLRETWIAPETSAIPLGVYLSTAVIAGCSVFAQKALHAARRGGQKSLSVNLWRTTLLGVIFLLLQTANWFVFYGNEQLEGAALYVFSFYMLTGLHAAHVVGGLILLAVILRKAVIGAYSPTWHPGVEYAALYWHFLGVVWVVTLLLLLAFC
jgi:heme/copper-type cytochrome/quinol oxidase subunit 3